MTTPLAALQALILSSSDVTTLVADRVYPSPGPQSPTPPYVTLLEVSDTPSTPLKGPATLSRAQIQVDVIAAPDGLATAFDVAEAIRVAGDGVAGTHAGLAIHARRVDRRHAYDEAANAQRVSIDFAVWYNL